MKLSSKQKICSCISFDNITATILAMIVGVCIESKATIMTATARFVFSVACIVIAVGWSVHKHSD